MSGTIFIWWESRTQLDLIQHGKIISSWIEFNGALRNQFYPLACMQTSMIDWKHLRKGKEKSVQAYCYDPRGGHIYG
jgi:hypothetical protein